MSAFRYEAARSDGVRVRGMIEATSSPDAAAVLSGRGLFPIAVKPAPSKPSGLFGRPSVRQQATVFQGLATLVDAGVPLERALAATEAVAPAGLRAPLARVRARVREGMSFASALAVEAGLCSGVTIGLVRAGERGVGLAPALGAAASQLEREAEALARVRAALTYPAILAAVGTASVGLIVLFVVPRFAALLGDLGQSLPLATRILLAGSAALRDYGLFLAVIVVVTGGLAARWVREHRSIWHEWLLRWPLVGSIRHALASARACRTVSALLGTGAPALAALAVAGEAAGDAAVRGRLVGARDRVAEGSSLSAALEATSAVTATAVQLAAIGEGSGRLPQLLAKAAEIDEQAAERRLKTLVGILEPALIVAFAGLVAFVAAALLQAVYAVRPM